MTGNKKLQVKVCRVYNSIYINTHTDTVTMFQLIPINKTVTEDEAQCGELKWYVQGPGSSPVTTTERDQCFFLKHLR